MDDPLHRIMQRIRDAAAKTGEITFSELNELLPSDKVTPEHIELILEKLSEIGICLVED